MTRAFSYIVGQENALWSGSNLGQKTFQIPMKDIRVFLGVGVKLHNWASKFLSRLSPNIPQDCTTL